MITANKLKAFTGNDSGTIPGSNYGGSKPQKWDKELYEYNRSRKTKPWSTRWSL